MLKMAVVPRGIRCTAAIDQEPRGEERIQRLSPKEARQALKYYEGKKDN